MARKFNSIDDFQRHLKRKWGLGEGESYKPWFTVRDVKNNKSFRKEIQGLKVPRKHHLLSSLEYNLFLVMDFREDVVDIREQFPLLPLVLSRKIAITLGVQHPLVVGAKTPTPFVMTTDLLITYRRNNLTKYIAFCVKSQEELSDERVLAKIEIERVWWESIGVTFKLFTGNKKVKYQSHNILWATDLQRHGLHEAIEKYADEAVALISVGKLFKQGICNTFSSRFNIDDIDSLNLLRFIIGKQLIKVELSEEYLDKALSVNVLENRYYRPEVAYASGS